MAILDGVDGNNQTTLPGFGHDDCMPIVGNRLAAMIRFGRAESDANGTDLRALASRTVRLEFRLRPPARMFAWSFHCDPIFKTLKLKLDDELAECLLKSDDESLASAVPVAPAKPNVLYILTDVRHCAAAWPHSCAARLCTAAPPTVHSMASLFPWRSCTVADNC